MSQKFQLSLLTYNIGGHARTADPGLNHAFREYQFTNRFSAILSKLDQCIVARRPDIILLQELCDVHLEHKLQTMLTRRSYDTICYNYHKFTGMKYLVAVRRAECRYRIQLLFGDEIVFTRSGEYYPSNATDLDDHNFGVTNPRTAKIIRIFDSQSQCNIALINIQLPSNGKAQVETCRILSERVSQLVSADPNIKIIVAGDFKDNGTLGVPVEGSKYHTNHVYGDTSCQMFTVSVPNTIDGLEHGSGKLLLGDTNRTISSSFFAFPFSFVSDQRYHFDTELEKTYDLPEEQKRVHILKIFEEKERAMGGQPDKVFYRGFSKCECRLLVDATGVDEYGDKYVKTKIVDAARRGEVAYPSDHQPVFATLEW